jgi:hypothetical protein
MKARGEGVTWVVTAMAQDVAGRRSMAVEAGNDRKGSRKVVCFETFRREQEGRQARVLPYLAPAEGRSPKSPFGGNRLTGQEIDHRRRMLRHLSEAPLLTDTGAS